MQPLFDNLNVIKRQFSLDSNDYRALQEMQAGGNLVIEALAYIRGRSLSDTFCIIDEAQNLTPHEITNHHHPCCRRYQDGLYR